MFSTFIYFNTITSLILTLLSSIQGKYQFFHSENVTIQTETIASCTNLTVKRLFDPERRIELLYRKPGDVENAIARNLMKDGPIVIGNRATVLKNQRAPGYVVIGDEGFVAWRGIFLGNRHLRTLQYLFLTDGRGDEVLPFARDLHRAGYRDVAFLAFDSSSAGTIIRASATGEEITLRSVGSCTPFTNDVDRIPSFDTDSRRFCATTGCILKYGIVTDGTVKFWRQEDTLKLKQNETLKAVGGLLVEHFGDYYNINIDSSPGINVTWDEGFARLINREIDVIVGPKPEDLSILDSLEIICWYMYRDMGFAGLVHFRTLQNDIVKMLMPFHYLVWVCVLVLLGFYILLVIALRRLSSMGLIEERLEFACVCSIMLAQGVTVPRNYGLRLVLLLWMMFSLYLSITYNSTFTSTLAQVETEDLLRDLEEVRDSGQPLGGPAIVRTYFDDQFMKDLDERYEVLGAKEAMDNVFTRDAFALLQRVTVDRINWDYRYNRSLRMYTLPSPVFRIPVFFFSRKGYVHRTALRQFVMKNRQAGLMYKLEDVFFLEEDKLIALTQSTEEILTMKHLRPIFEIFFMCQGISCLILLVELIQARLSKKCRINVI